MKILLLSRELPPGHAGGIGTYTATIAPALAGRGHEVHVLSCALGQDRSDELYQGVWWHRRPLVALHRVARPVGLRHSGLRLAAALSCRREVANLGTRFDIVESPEFLAESLLLSRTPVVVHLHTPYHLLSIHNRVPMGADRRLADRLERTSARRADAVTSPSRLLASQLRRTGWLTHDPVIIRLPVDLDSSESLPDANTTDPMILLIGRLEPRKAPEVAVEAAAILAADVPGLCLTFVGRSSGKRDGVPYGRWVSSLANDRGVAARFVPQVPPAGVREEFARARVVAVPSSFESFSMAALEGMAAARPVTCTHAVGASEMLVDEKAGAIVPPGDAEALAAALKPYLVDPDAASRAGASGRRIVERYCSPSVIAAEREQCYENVIARGAHRP